MTATRRKARVPELHRALTEKVETSSTDESSQVVTKSVEPTSESTSNCRFYVPILKAATEERTLTGIVLAPDTIDAHGDTIPADVIRKAAHKFLADYNLQTTLGLQHKEFNQPLQLVESWIAPMDLVLGSTTVKAGSWIMTIKVMSSAIWKKVKEGKLTGFSIGGRAKVKNLQAKVA